MGSKRKLQQEAENAELFEARVRETVREVVQSEIQRYDAVRRKNEGEKRPIAALVDSMLSAMDDNMYANLTDPAGVQHTLDTDPMAQEPSFKQIHDLAEHGLDGLDDSAKAALVDSLVDDPMKLAMNLYALHCARIEFPKLVSAGSSKTPKTAIFSELHETLYAAISTGVCIGRKYEQEYDSALRPVDESKDEGPVPATTPVNDDVDDTRSE